MKSKSQSQVFVLCILLSSVVGCGGSPTEHIAVIQSPVAIGLTRKVEVRVLDPDSHFYSTFQSHNQKMVQNRRGIFFAYIHRADANYYLNTWRLVRSEDGGASFTTVYEGQAGTKPPVIETDEEDNIYLIHSDWTRRDRGYGNFYRFSPVDNYEHPLIRTIPGVGFADKVAMFYDVRRRQLYYVANTAVGEMKFHILEREGTVRHGYRLTQPSSTGEDAHYPLLSLDESGILYVAWTGVIPQGPMRLPVHWSPAGNYSADAVLLTADVDGRQGDDLVLQSLGTTSWRVQTALSTGDGKFTVPVLFTEARSVAGLTPAIGDVDGDGIADLVVHGGTATRWEARVARGRGDGTFGPSLGWEHVGALPVGQFVTGDFNSDGRLDLALIRPDSRGLQALSTLATGTGSFHLPQTTTSAGDVAGYNVHLGDVNADRCVDIILQHASAAGWQVAVAYGACNGAFGALTWWSAPGDFASCVPAVGDFNGDGQTDVALSRQDRSSSHTAIALMGPPPCSRGVAAAFRPHLIHSRPGNFAGWSPLFVDFNGDKKTDLLLHQVGRYWTAHLGASRMGVINCDQCESPFEAGQTFTNPAVILAHYTDFSGFNFRTADFNGDKKADILLERHGPAWHTRVSLSNMPYIYRSIQVVASPDGGEHWQTLSGAPLAVPIVAGEQSPAGQYKLADELTSSTWLQSVLARDGKVHLSYLAFTPCPLRQHYVRYSVPGASRDIDIYPVWEARNNPRFPVVSSLDGFFVSPRDGAGGTIYSVQQVNHRIVVLASDDQGETWFERGISDPLEFVIYALGGYRWVTDDGFIIGAFTRAAPAPQQTYFFRLDVRSPREGTLPFSAEGRARRK